MTRGISNFIWPVLFLLAATPAPGREALRIETPGRPSTILLERIENPQQVVVSARDPNGEPIPNLGPTDFNVGKGIRKGRVVSVEPLQSRENVPLNLVLVIDNSFSMQERQAIPPLLAALEELLGDVRPIDTIHAVVFDDRALHLAADRALHVKTFTASRPAEWKGFFPEAFDRGITSRTFLYEAILAGLGIIRKMPADQPKLMLVFSDGEDLNSTIGTKEVDSGATDLEKFLAFCIDYMPGEKTDAFLARFAATHGGRTWKARSAAELTPIFQSFKTTLFHKYRLSYDLLNPIALEPKSLNFELLAATTGRPAAGMVFFHTNRAELPDAYRLFSTPEEAAGFRPDDLTGALNRYFNILNFLGHTLREDPEVRIGIIGCTSDTGPERDNLELALNRAAAVKAYLRRVWDIAPERMRIEARNLPEDPSASDTRAGRLENQRVEFIFSSEAARARAIGGLITETQNQKTLTVRLDLSPHADIRSGEILILGEDRVLTTLPIPAAPERVYAVPLDTLGRERLAGLGAIEALLRITDASGRGHEAASDLCHIRTHTRELIRDIGHPPYGTLRLEPKPVKVEEVTVVDSSPLLHHVYFDFGRSEIAERYRVFATSVAANAFDETTLSGTMEKYRHVLNIIGKRAAERPRARLTLTGCTSDTGAEKGNLTLARRRAETVRAYLQTTWGIDPARVQIEARGLPAAASSPGIPEGRAENQRVEIAANDPSILDTVRSTRIEALSDTDWIRIAPELEDGLALKRWRLAIYGDSERLEALDGEGPLEAGYVLALKEVGLLTIGRYRSITAELDGVDAHGRRLQVKDSSEVHLLRREERLARREGYRVVEKYALILFDFNRAEIGERNRAVVARIGARLKEHPGATVRIIGYTDIIGSLDYNIELSRKRSQAAVELLVSGGVPARDRITHEGKGPTDPLYDNRLPEGRAYNRTVSVILEYEQKP